MRVAPERSEFVSMGAQRAPDGSRATHAPVVVSLHADCETPISIFQRMASASGPSGQRGSEHAFLLESVEGGETMGRYSFLAVDVERTLDVRDGEARVRGAEGEDVFAVRDPLDALSRVMGDISVAPHPALPRFVGGAVGYVGFDAMCAFEPVPLAGGRGLGWPTAMFLLARDVVVYDHRDHRVLLVTLAPLAGDRGAAWEAARARLSRLLERYMAPSVPEPPWWLDEVPDASLSVTPNRTDEDFCAAVTRAKQAIAEGELFQVVLSRRETIEADVDPLLLYRALRATSPSPYMFLLRLGERSLVGASPEVLVRLDEGTLLVRPIAGTRPRGETAEEDAALEADLLADEKELAEHRMLLDLGRNDVGRVAKVGSVRVKAPLHIERYSHVMHIVSDVEAELAEGKGAYDVFRACFPAGTVSGAPKVRACQWLSELEPDRRGPYAGAVGYFDHAGNIDTAIAIRTMMVEPGAVHVQAGAGIVFDSVPESELEECQNKARAARVALRRALHRQAALLGTEVGARLHGVREGRGASRNRGGEG